MRVTPLIFEDHSLSHFRPLAWSQPTFENRVGMFSLRERVGHLTAEGIRSGALLSRPMLDGLQQAAGWADGAVAAGKLLEDLDQPCLWINGRCGWSHDRLQDLLGRAQSGEKFHLADSLGSLAFSCDDQTSRAVLAHWMAWEDAAAARGCWADPGLDVPRWEPEAGLLPEPAAGPAALQWIWEMVPATPAGLEADLGFVSGGATFKREPYGVVADPGIGEAPVWARESSLTAWSGAQGGRGPVIQNPENVWCGPEVMISPAAALDASRGPVVLDRGVTVMPGAFLEGPLYIGAGSTVKAGATIYGESSFGVVNKISGEIGESIFGDFSNKQHDGFIGHAVLGSWVNLGAMTTCSDLKNNYGPVRVDLGRGQINSGLRFVGLLMADHAKTAIGTLFNTGTSVGFATNIFGGAMPPKFVGNFRWGGLPDGPDYAVDRALETAEVVMGRRGCLLTEDHRRLFALLSSG